MKTFKTKLLTMAVLLCSTAANAQNFEVDGIYYSVTSNTKLTVEVKYQGDLFSEYSDEYTGEVTIPASVTYNGTPYSVTKIENGTFYGCTSLTSVTIPESVTSIGGSTFYGCTSLTSVTIPESVTSIGSSAFFGCSSLASVTIPSAVTSIGVNAFYSCSSLTSVTIPDFVTSIGTLAFGKCSSLMNVTIGNSVTSIGESAFRECSNLKSINIPESVTSMGAYTFLDCPLLNNITIPNSVTSIGKEAFRNCSSLTSITISESMTSIEPLTFYDCSGLTSVTIPESVTSIGDNAFCRCTGLTSITIPNSVTSIGSSSFSGCSNLTDFTIKNPTPFSVSTMISLCSSATLTVPNGSAKAYSDLGGFWSQFTTIKEEANINIPEANKWSTCALAFDAALPEGVRAFVSTGMEDNYVLLEEVETLEANTPYVLYAQNGYEGTLSGTVDVTNYQTSVTDGALNGAITQQTISEGYVLQNQGEGSKFYNVNGQTFTIPAGKCWLSAISVSGARSVMMRFPGGATDIEGLYVERPAETDGKIYTLDGVEVETMQSGHIYIKDGKKVLKR